MVDSGYNSQINWIGNLKWTLLFISLLKWTWPNYSISLVMGPKLCITWIVIGKNSHKLSSLLCHILKSLISQIVSSSLIGQITTTLCNNFDGFYSLLTRLIIYLWLNLKSGNTNNLINESKYYFNGVTKRISSGFIWDKYIFL